ncbi:hypothetical protein PAHAL_9G063600 [Panicum hallii]|uniref:HIG1 domain-containing protein n=1 Tax=Panicum hallii TaxID=206008 RepID=A0A2T8I0J7_9POAL|nr:hypothetical protein PAHAL_9G063600 [Panicum hallii]
MALIHYSRGARLGSVREKFPGKIAEEKSALQWASEWVANHKLRAFGTLWLSGIGGSIAYNWSRPGMKTSVKIIDSRSVAFTSYTACCVRFV